MLAWLAARVFSDGTLFLLQVSLLLAISMTVAAHISLGCYRLRCVASPHQRKLASNFSAYPSRFEGFGFLLMVRGLEKQRGMERDTGINKDAGTKF